MLNTHRQIQKIVLFILCIGEINLNLRQVPLEQVHHSNLNIAYTYDQLRKSKACKESKGYNKIGQQIKKCEKVCAIHISKINLVIISGNISKKLRVSIRTILTIIMKY